MENEDREDFESSASSNFQRGRERMLVCVCVCVCVRKRERGRERGLKRGRQKGKRVRDINKRKREWKIKTEKSLRVELRQIFKEREKEW